MSRSSSIALASPKLRRRPVPGASDADLRPHPGRRLSERAFLDWVGEKTRAEWVDGEVIVMAPVGDSHADLNLFLGAVLRQFVEHHDLGEIRGPETMVRLKIGGKVERRLPDLLFVAAARAAAIKPTFVDGPPDLIVEIVSPGSVDHDWRDKYFDYEAAGVGEYVVVDRASEKVKAYALGRRSKQFEPVEPDADGRLRSKAVKGFYLRPQWLLGPRPPKVATVLRELGVR
ncbi:MAG TPA: Uma2 family endonuclease [Tepidisphaeraceae bacterium]|nr:Uma2 family endonuclease [Tepidisphaeraceae bacterium]